MGSTVFPVTPSKTRYALTLTSGTSWTVPTGVTYVNVTLTAGGGAGDTTLGANGKGGQVVTSNLSTTPGASITYAIGAGGTTANASGGNTTFTGATTATAGVGYNGSGSPVRNFANNGGLGTGGGSPLLNGGNGQIDIEYWV